MYDMVEIKHPTSLTDDMQKLLLAFVPEDGTRRRRDHGSIQSGTEFTGRTILEKNHIRNYPSQVRLYRDPAIDVKSLEVSQSPVGLSSSTNIPPRQTGV